MTYRRYVALGDSQTEGLGDGDDTVGLRGFADRLAEHLARDRPGLGYADLAVRSRLAAQIHAEQLAPALALRPDLATVVTGVNDLLRPRFDAHHDAGHQEAMFAALTAQGARVATDDQRHQELPGRGDEVRQARLRLPRHRYCRRGGEQGDGAPDDLAFVLLLHRGHTDGQARLDRGAGHRRRGEVGNFESSLSSHPRIV
ncbi:hypothetical protein SUDANB178_00750 [Streptomyces sp. enrichment culture]